MGKVHQLLAVENDIRQSAANALKVVKKFCAKDKYFLGQNKTYQPKDEEGHKFPDENVHLQFTVDQVLSALVKEFIPHIDLQLQKEMSNSASSAVVALGENHSIELSAPALLNLESRLQELKAVYEELPVNDTAIVWEYDSQTKRYISKPRMSDRHQKVEHWEVVVPATKEHAAQIQQMTKDDVIGLWTTQILSGMLSPVEKAERLERLGELIMTVKKALRQANDAEVSRINVGGRIMNYINTGVWSE